MAITPSAFCALSLLGLAKANRINYREWLWCMIPLFSPVLLGCCGGLRGKIFQNCGHGKNFPLKHVHEPVARLKLIGAIGAKSLLGLFQPSLVGKQLSTSPEMNGEALCRKYDNFSHIKANGVCFGFFSRFYPFTCKLKAHRGPDQAALCFSFALEIEMET